MEMFLKCAALRRVGLQLVADTLVCTKCFSSPNWRNIHYQCFLMNLKGEVRAVHCFFGVLLRRKHPEKANEGWVLCTFETGCSHCLRFVLPCEAAAFPQTGVFVVGQLSFSWWHFIWGSWEPETRSSIPRWPGRAAEEVVGVSLQFLCKIRSCLRKSWRVQDERFVHLPYGLHISDSMSIWAFGACAGKMWGILFPLVSLAEILDFSLKSVLLAPKYSRGFIRCSWLDISKNNPVSGLNDSPTSMRAVHLILYVARYLNWLDLIHVQLSPPLICSSVHFVLLKPDVAQHDNIPVVGYAGTWHNMCQVSFESFWDQVSVKRRSF